MGATSRPAVAPLYASIASELRERILDGTYGPGALLPSRNEICAEFGVSAITARDALAVLSYEGYARAIRGRGHIVRRKRPRMTVPARLYGGDPSDGLRDMLLHRLDVYQEPPPENIALPLQTGAGEVAWVWRAVWAAASDKKPACIHVSWLPGLTGEAGESVRGISPDLPWPEAVRQITGHPPDTVRQSTRARGANPFEAETFEIAQGTTIFVTHATIYDAAHQPIEHSRYAWPTEMVRMSDYYRYAPGT